MEVLERHEFYTKEVQCIKYYEKSYNSKNNYS